MKPKAIAALLGGGVASLLGSACLPPDTSQSPEAVALIECMEVILRAAGLAAVAGAVAVACLRW